MRKLRKSVVVAGVGVAVLGLAPLPTAYSQEIPEPDAVGDDAKAGAQATPEGTLIEAEVHPLPAQKVVNDAEALGGKATSNARAWGSIAYAPLPPGPTDFKIWVRHKYGPLLIKSFKGGKQLKDLRWIRSNPTAWKWSEGGTFSRENLGDGIIILRDDKKTGPDALVDAIVLTPAEPLPPFEPDANATPLVVQATAQWNKTVATLRPEQWGFNDYEVRDAEKAKAGTYQKLLADLHPALIRIHQGDLVTAWTNPETRTWDVEKIKAGMSVATGYKGAKIMLNVARWPKWLSTNPVLSLAEEDEFVKLIGDYVRVFQSINVRVDYWEIPNEYERRYEKAGKLNDLWRMWNKLAAEIRRVDPQARVGGPALSSPETRWVEGFLKNCGQNADFISWHNYATGDLSTSNEAVFARPAAFAKLVKGIRTLAQKWVPNRKLEFFMTEYNIKWVWDPIERRHGNNIGAIFQASMVRNLALAANGQGIDGMMLWHAKGPAYGIVLTNDTPRSPYYLFRWGTHYLSGSIAAQSSADETSLELLPIVRADKTRSLLLIVKANRRVTIPNGAALFPFSAGQKVRAQRIDAQGYSEQVDLPKTGDWTLPGYSVTLLTSAPEPTN